MKKNVLKGILILSVIFFTSCKSTKVDEDVKAAQADKNYVGWVDSTGKDVVYKDGLVHLRLKQNLGTFNLGVINEKGKVVPVLSTADEFTSSVTYLKTLKKTYTLRRDSYIDVFAARNKNGVELNYSYENVFDVNINFETMRSGEYDASDMIKVTYTVTNRGIKKDEFAVKTIFDTVLGESDKYHFYTSENLPVKNEVAYRTMKNQKWFTSKNKNAAIEFILDGADTTAPEVVALANYSTFQKNTWEPEMTSYRAFDTVLSYNNSAVGIIWPAAKLKPGESAKNVFYISVASDEELPAGHKLIFKPEPEEEVKKVELKSEAGATNDVEAAEDDIEEAPVPVEEKVVEKAEEKLESLPVEVEPLPETPVSTEVLPEVDEKLNEVSDERLSAEYIQKLIDRISELENNTSKVDSEELDRLNEELDEILSALR